MPSPDLLPNCSFSSLGSEVKHSVKKVEWEWSWDETNGISHEHCRVLWSLDYGSLIKPAATANHSIVHPIFCSLAFLQVLVDDEIEKGCMHVKILQEPDSKKLLFSFVAYQRDKQLDEPIENFT